MQQEKAPALYFFPFFSRETGVRSEQWVFLQKYGKDIGSDVFMYGSTAREVIYI